MTTIATLFTGFDCVGVGARSAGIEPIWGIEIDSKIAEVANANGSRVKVMDILRAYPDEFKRPDILHASPECQRASLANSNRGETKLDLDFAYKICLFVSFLQPKIFTLENVQGYRLFKSWTIISNTLNRLGYWVDVQILNAADFGVPQTRRRMIVRAIKGEMVPQLPKAVPWIGWYEAIEDLLPNLPESKFAPWQLARLPEEIKSFLMDGSGNTNFNDAEPGNEIRELSEPAHVVASAGGGRIPRAFLVHPTDQRTMPVVDQNEPVFTVMGNAKQPRAFLIGNDANGDDRKKLNVSAQELQSMTITQNGGKLKGFLIDSQNGSRIPTAIKNDDPAYSITNQGKGYSRAWLFQGRVVKMTPRALTRFQSIPDSFILPDNNALACKGIGNGVPPLMMEIIYRQLKEYV